MRFRKCKASDWQCWPRKLKDMQKIITNNVSESNQWLTKFNIDWRRSNEIVVSSDSSLILYNLSAVNEPIPVLYELNQVQVQALKFSPHGSQLASDVSGVAEMYLQLWQISDKLFMQKKSECSLAKQKPFALWNGSYIFVSQIENCSKFNRSISQNRWHAIFRQRFIYCIC